MDTKVITLHKTKCVHVHTKQTSTVINKGELHGIGLELLLRGEVIAFYPNSLDFLPFKPMCFYNFLTADRRIKLYFYAVAKVHLDIQLK